METYPKNEQSFEGIIRHERLENLRIVTSDWPEQPIHWQEEVGHGGDVGKVVGMYFARRHFGLTAIFTLALPAPNTLIRVQQP